MTTFEKGDKFTIGDQITGEVVRVRETGITVKFDGNVFTYGTALRENNLNPEWFGSLATKVTPGAFSILADLKPGDKFTIQTSEGRPYWDHENVLVFLREKDVGGVLRPTRAVTAASAALGMVYSDFWVFDSDIITKID